MKTKGDKTNKEEKKTQKAYRLTSPSVPGSGSRLRKPSEEVFYFAIELVTSLE
jgi:hypothetical protein